MKKTEIIDILNGTYGLNKMIREKVKDEETNIESFSMKLAGEMGISREWKNLLSIIIDYKDDAVYYA